MGCVGSTNTQQREHTVLNKDLVSSIGTNCGDKSNDTHNNITDSNMSRKAAKPVKTEESSDMLKTLEQKIRSFVSISDDDMKEALAIASKNPDLHDEFDHLVNIMHEVVRKNPRQFMQQLDDSRSSSWQLMDFFAVVGGAKATVEMYEAQLKSVGITHMTDQVYSDANEEQIEALLIIATLRHFWVNATDSSLTYAERLAEAKLFPYLAEDIRNLEKTFEADSGIFDDSVTILHNCAKNRQLRQYYRDISAVQLLTPILARKEKDVKLLTLLTVSYIIDEEDNHLLLGDDSDFDFLLENVSFAWAEDSHRTYSGYSVAELLQGLVNLAQNDDNKKLLMKKGALTHLKPILKEGSDAEKQEAAKIVWELAFDKENKQLLKEDTELMDLLHQLKDSADKGVAKSCGGTLWVLNMDKKLHTEPNLKGKSTMDSPLSSGLPPGPPPPPTQSSKAPVGGKLPPPAPPAPGASGQGHIMISYQWDHQKMLMQIRDGLRSQGFQVWMDVDNIKGSTLQAMAEAVEGSAAVLLCMSQRYKDSPNCRTEAEYAFALQQPIIPLLMERNYKPDGWLGILKGSKLFFDFSGKYPYEKKLDELVKELGHRGRSYVSESEVDGPILAEKVRPVGSAPATVSPVVDVSAWAQKDVHNWLSQNHLNGCPKLQSLSGENIKFLQKLSQRAPEFYFTYLKQDLKLTTLNDLMHFSDAIDKLP